MATAVTLDWDQQDWNKGSTEQTFYNIGNSGVDVTISLSLSYDSASYRNPYNRWDRYKTTSSFIDGGPDDNNTFGGDGYIKDEESLYMGINLATDDRNVSYLDVTISFSQSVTDLDFSLFDVDSFGYNYYGGYETGIQFRDVIDQIQSSNNGSDAGTASVSYNSSKIYTETNGGDTAYLGNTRLNDGGNDQNDNPRSVLDLGWSSPVDTVSFRYSTTGDAVADPGQQAISLSDISFCSYKAVPEPATYLVGTLIPLGLLIMNRRRKKVEKAPSN